MGADMQQEKMDDGAELEDDGDRVQYLTFGLDGEHYGLEILTVQEIRGWEPVTRVPNSPAYVRGVVNLRGTIVPVIDMRLRFGLETAPYGKETVVIVVRSADTSGQERSVGLVVDAVSDVISAREDEISGTPEFGAGVPTQHLKGLVRAEGQMVMLLDVPGLVCIDDESA